MTDVNTYVIVPPDRSFTHFGRRTVLETVFGVFTMIFGMASFVIGLTMQAIKQYKEKKFGLHIAFAGLGTIACAFRIVYSSLVEAWWIVPADAYGLLISSVIIWQYGAYEKGWWAKRPTDFEDQTFI